MITVCARAGTLRYGSHKFCEVNDNYQLHKLLHAISHPLYGSRLYILSQKKMQLLKS